MNLNLYKTYVYSKDFVAIYGIRITINTALSVDYCTREFPQKQVDILISKHQVLQILYLKHHDNVYYQV